MLDGLAGEGHDAHLLTYDYGADCADGVDCANADAPRAWTRHRSPSPRGLRPRTLRSGPSWSKLALDARMVAEARRLARALEPAVVIAHNVEAALVARAAGLDAVYYAHTRFDVELPTYRPRFGRALHPLGAALDRAAAGASRVVAITPSLAAHLEATLGRSVATLLPPWSLDGRRSTQERARDDAALPSGASPTMSDDVRDDAALPAAPSPTMSDDAAERSAARASLSLPRDRPVALYAGNLDGYQGWEHAGAAAARAGFTWLVATESDPTPLRAFPHVRARLATEADRRRAHAACDVALVPRRAPGGLPIKLLDALARDVPVVAMHRALAGLAPDGVEVCQGDDTAALADGLRRALARPPRGGRAWVARHLDARTFARRVEALGNAPAP